MGPDAKFGQYFNHFRYKLKKYRKNLENQQYFNCKIIERSNWNISCEEGFGNWTSMIKWNLII